MLDVCLFIKLLVTYRTDIEEFGIPSTGKPSLPMTTNEWETAVADVSMLLQEKVKSQGFYGRFMVMILVITIGS